MEIPQSSREILTERVSHKGVGRWVTEGQQDFRRPVDTEIIKITVLNYYTTNYLLYTVG